MKSASLLIALFALTQTGCAEMVAAQRRADEKRCLEEGFRPGTDGFRLCRLTIEAARDKHAVEQRDEDARRKEQEEFEKFSRGCTFKPLGTLGC